MDTSSEALTICTVGGVLLCRTEGNCIDLAFALSDKMEEEVRSNMQHYIDKATAHKQMGGMAFQP